MYVTHTSIMLKMSKNFVDLVQLVDYQDYLLEINSA